ncbi:hypothetical protein SDD30_14070 [Moorella naiadis]|uniref:hypothetical protein n=1 Tax=Moorella naiadis (nom. illeg.) TaxID=3093670 RepID=UPI003D9CB5D7
MSKKAKKTEIREPETKKQEPVKDGKELAEGCQMFFIFGTKRECAHCLWLRLQTCQRGLRYVRVAMPDKLAEKMPEAVSAGDGAADIGREIVAGSNIVAAAS